MTKAYDFLTGRHTVHIRITQEFYVQSTM